MKRPCLLGFLLSLPVIVTAVSSPAGAQGNTEVVRFAVIGDRTGGHQPGIYEQIVTEVERMRPDFVLTVGDQIEGYSEDTTTLNTQWEEYKALVAPLSMHLYLTPGNHDITTDKALPSFSRFNGPPSYSFDREGLHFIVLDVSRWESSKELPAEQIAWLASDLEANRKARYTFVFFHKPFWIETAATGKPDTLHSLFRAYGVDAVFSGHAHLYFSGAIDGIKYTAVGSSGGGCDPGPTGLQYHFTWVTVDENGISIAPIKIGAVLPWDEVTAADLRTIERIELSGIEFEKPLPIGEDLRELDSTLVVTINNTRTDAILEDTLRWDLAQGWMVDPQKSGVRIPPGGRETRRFTVRMGGNLYPVPTLALRFPYSSTRTYAVKRPLAVAREAKCLRVSTPPVIDGTLSETCWKEPVSKFFSPEGGPMPTDSAWFYFAYDRKNLYLAARCRESKMDSMVARVTTRDGAIYGEDCVGYFLRPGSSAGPVYQIYFNPLGTVFDQKITFSPEGGAMSDLAWNGTYRVKSTRGKGFWTVEARLPLSQFGIGADPGQTWRLNFRRKQKRLNTSADWQVPIGYDPNSMGILVRE